jgi:hypothetical protein
MEEDAGGDTFIIYNNNTDLMKPLNSTYEQKTHNLN